MPLMRKDASWHHGQTLAAGQVAEFKVWSELIRLSTGALHIFLPRFQGWDIQSSRIGSSMIVRWGVELQSSGPAPCRSCTPLLDHLNRASSFLVH